MIRLRTRTVIVFAFWITNILLVIVLIIIIIVILVFVYFYFVFVHLNEYFPLIKILTAYTTLFNIYSVQTYTYKLTSSIIWSSAMTWYSTTEFSIDPPPSSSSSTSDVSSSPKEKMLNIGSWNYTQTNKQPTAQPHNHTKQKTKFAKRIRPEKKTTTTTSCPFISRKNKTNNCALFSLSQAKQ